MKKKKILLITGVFFVIISSRFIFTHIAGKKPFKDLEASNIISASVRLSPPDKTIQIIDLDELATYLNDVVIYGEDNSYTEYAGQGVIFTIAKADGTQTEVMAYNPFLVIDGIGYKTKYKPCEALNAYANRLLNAKP